MGRLMRSLGNCITPETAKKLVELKPESVLQARLDELADKCNEGLLTTNEREEYTEYVLFDTLIGYLKSRSRILISKTDQRK